MGKKEDKRLIAFMGGRPICNLCNKPIDDVVYQAIYDKDQKKIVYRHRDSYCQRELKFKPVAPYAYMKRWGQTKHD